MTNISFLMYQATRQLFLHQWSIDMVGIDDHSADWYLLVYTKQDIWNTVYQYTTLTHLEYYSY